MTNSDHDATDATPNAGQLEQITLGVAAGLEDFSAQLRDGRTLDASELAPLLYENLYALAAACFRRGPSDPHLQPTALVNETYLKLAENAAGWKSKGHFLAVAATAMRHVLINAAKSHRRVKRGGGRRVVTLTGAVAEESSATVDLLDLDDALQRLSELNPRWGRIVELRYFAGLSLEETAELLEVSRTIIIRDWRRARAWLSLYLEESE